MASGCAKVLFATAASGDFKEICRRVESLGLKSVEISHADSYEKLHASVFASEYDLYLIDSALLYIGAGRSAKQWRRAFAPLFSQDLSPPIVLLIDSPVSIAMSMESEEWLEVYNKADFDARELLRCLRFAQRHSRLRSALERRLRQSEARFQEIVESLNDGLTICDTSGEIHYVNSRFTELTGYGREDVLGKKSFAFLRMLAECRKRHSREESEDFFSDSISAISQEHITEIRTKGGANCWVRLGRFPLRQLDGTISGSLVAVTDITERKEIEDQLFHAQKMEAVGRLAGGVAHDFNNLLTAVLGYSGLLLNRLPKTDPHRRELWQIRNASERASTLVGQLLTFSRKQVMKPRLVDLNAVVEETSRMLKRLIGEDVTLKLDYCEEICAIRADPGQLQQVLLNLAINARDAMPDGGTITITTERRKVPRFGSAAVPGVGSGDFVVLTVSDTGCGMSEDVREHIFEPFYTTKDCGKGTGLGLSTVYGAITQSSGFLNVTSAPGEGTSFYIYLPYRSEPIGVEEDRASGEFLKGGNETILLVEDEESVRLLLNEVLQRLGYSVLVARDGSEAIRLSDTYEDFIDLMITDVVMPNLGGYQAAEHVRRNRPKTKILVISGYPTSGGGADSFLLQRGHAFLPKPFSPSALSRAVREVLESNSKSINGLSNKPDSSLVQFTDA